MDIHSPSPMPSTRILLVVADPLLRETLTDILHEEGYDLRQAASLAQASLILDEETFGLVMMELLDVRADAPLLASSALARRANPTPVGIVTGWNVTNESARKAGFAFYLPMPFELDTLLASIARAMRTDLTPEQERQAKVAQAYLSALSKGLVDDALALCTETIRYHRPNASTPAGGQIHDKASLRAYVVATLGRYPGGRIENVNIYALPGRLAARFTLCWRPTPEHEKSASGAMLFRFEGKRIAEIGVEYDEARHMAAHAAHTATSLSLPEAGDIGGEQEMGAK